MKKLRHVVPRRNLAWERENQIGNRRIITVKGGLNIGNVNHPKQYQIAKGQFNVIFIIRLKF